MTPPRPVIPPEDTLATSGLGPRWRLLAACRKGIACPRCGPGLCAQKPICLERLWAYAALRRRERAGDDRVAEARHLLATTQDIGAALINLAVATGVIRLERVPGSDTEVQWVDAV